MAAKKELSRISHAVIGDEIFFHHLDAPCCGKVLSVGKHGVTVDHEGKNHRIEWHRVIGHKKRATQKLRILHEGEDGVIVEDQSGKKRFMHMSSEARESQRMVKSGDERRIVLFMKSDSIANRAGLHLENRTDRTGRNQKKWVRSGERDAPKGDKQAKQEEAGAGSFGVDNVKAGHKLKFKLGELDGHGEVVGNPGKDGAHIKDPDGHIHQVRWGQVYGRADKYDGEQKQGRRQEHGKLFDDELIASLPETSRQPHDNWEDLVKHGKEGLEQFKEALGKVQQVMGLKSGMAPEDVTPEQWENDDGFLFVAPLKGEKRTREKVEGEYDGDWSQLRDIVRGTISVPTMVQVKQAIGHLHEMGIELAQKPKNRFANPTDAGYRDLMAIVKLPNGMVAELQIHVKAMTLAKEHGHKHYEITRKLEAHYGEDKPSDKWSDEDHHAYYKSLKAQKTIYSDAWNKVTGSGSGESLTKAFLSKKIILLFKKQGREDEK
ncbi:MAG TPA: hypothetical protein PK580_00030 [Nitrosomonas halophila]|nr:hypothetical protein [Nitrosomonas halophila]